MKTAFPQRGAVLIVSMIILLVLSLISVSAARTILLQEKMTFASRDAKVALEVAEALVRQGESEIEKMETTGNFSPDANVNWLHEAGEGLDNLTDAASWSDANSKLVTVEMGSGEQKHSMYGRVFIEMAGTAEQVDPSGNITIEGYGQTTGGGEVQVFRVVALGYGVSGSTTRTVISHYGKRF